MCPFSISNVVPLTIVIGISLWVGDKGARLTRVAVRVDIPRGRVRIPGETCPVEPLEKHNIE
jgi:hypothetical protein